jgi:phosphoribosylanthranilate isomerase
MSVRVKICGITNREDAALAVDAGADAIGFIFVENTPRFMTPEAVRPIVAGLPPFVTPVGVFWDHPRAHVKAIVETCGLRALQFHGSEPPEDLTGYDVPVIKTIKLPAVSTVEGLPEYRVRDQVEVMRYQNVVAAVLLDTAVRWSEGETREPIEWRMAALPAFHRPRLILSGGLTPDNVGRAVSIVRPYAVDVNSGVEARPGRKDPGRLRQFVAEARRAA